MKKIVIGKAYAAHAFIDGQRITGSGFYHFIILRQEKQWIDSKAQTISLGLRLGVEISPFDDYSQCFWFDENGVHDAEGLRLELRRKINKN